MLIIVDKRMPCEAKEKLAKSGELLELETSGIVYDAISGHPDIFFTPVNSQLIVAPNLPGPYKNALQKEGIKMHVGHRPLGKSYPQTAWYNAAINKKFIVHHPEFTDQQIISHLPETIIRIPVKQGYTRCNLIFLNGHSAITSDSGIDQKLKKFNIETLLVDPRPVKLEGFTHGFFGGACGLGHGKFFLNGNLKFHHQEEAIRKFVSKSGLELIELCRLPVMDAGGIFFC